MTLSDPDKNKVNPKSIKAVILDADFESISGGKISEKTRIGSSIGYAGQVPFKVYYEVPNQPVKVYEGETWSKASPLKKLGAKLQREIYLMLVAIDGKVCPLYICQMSIYGMGSMQFGKVEGKDPRLSLLTIDSFIKMKNRFNNVNLIPDFQVQAADPVKHGKLLDAATVLYHEKIHPFIDEVLNQGSSDAPSAAEADAGDFEDDFEDEFDGKVVGDDPEFLEEEKPDDDLPF